MSVKKKLSLLTLSNVVYMGISPGSGSDAGAALLLDATFSRLLLSEWRLRSDERERREERLLCSRSRSRSRLSLRPRLRERDRDRLRRRSRSGERRLERSRSRSGDRRLERSAPLLDEDDDDAALTSTRSFSSFLEVSRRVQNPMCCLPSRWA